MKMNQRHPQSRHTPHGGSEKTDDRGKYPSGEILGTGGRGGRAVRLRVYRFLPSITV